MSGTHRPRCHVGNQNPLGSGLRGLPDRARSRVGRDAMDRRGARLSARAWGALVHARRLADLSAAGLLLVVVLLRRLRAGDIPDRRLHRRVGRVRRDRRRHRHVGVACARAEERRDLWLGALGHPRGAGHACSRSDRSCSDDGDRAAGSAATSAAHVRSTIDSTSSKPESPP